MNGLEVVMKENVLCKYQIICYGKLDFDINPFNQLYYLKGVKLVKEIRSSKLLFGLTDYVGVAFCYNNYEFQIIDKFVRMK